jgi:hypothetical protein
MTAVVLNLLLHISRLNFLSLDTLHPLTLQNKMKVRRSARNQAIPFGHTPGNAPARKRKASGGEDEAQSKQQKKKRIAISSRKTSKTNENAHSTGSPLDRLPTEIIQLIIESVSTYPTRDPSDAYNSPD